MGLAFALPARSMVPGSCCWILVCRLPQANYATVDKLSIWEENAVPMGLQTFDSFTGSYCSGKLRVKTPSIVHVSMVRRTTVCCLLWCVELWVAVRCVFVCLVGGRGGEWSALHSRMSCGGRGPLSSVHPCMSCPRPSFVQPCVCTPVCVVHSFSITPFVCMCSHAPLGILVPPGHRPYSHV